MRILKKPTKTKILHIGLDTGGVRTFLGLIFEYSERLDFEYIVLAPDNPVFRDYCEKVSVKYYPVNLLRGGNPFTVVSSLIEIIRILLREKPDIIHTHSAKGGFLGRLAAKLTGSKNVIYTPHAFSYLAFSGIKRTLFYSLEMLAKRWTSILLAISYSEEQRSLFELGYEKNSVKLILNSIPIPQPSTYQYSEKSIKIRMIGRLTLQKNPMLFLEIAKVITDKYKNVEFSILGAGIHDELSNDLQKFINRNSLGKTVKIEKWVDQNNAELFLRETDIYVMTSIFEGLSYSLLEAMALSKACIVSAVDGNKDVIHNNETGFTCMNKSEFCEKIELLIHDEHLRKNLGFAARSYVRMHHNILKNIGQLENLYLELDKRPVNVGKKVTDDNILSLRGSY